jgi:hypothetical protein
LRFNYIKKLDLTSFECMTKSNIKSVIVIIWVIYGEMARVLEQRYTDFWALLIDYVFIETVVKQKRVSMRKPWGHKTAKKYHFFNGQICCSYQPFIRRFLRYYIRAGF